MEPFDQVEFETQMQNGDLKKTRRRKMSLADPIKVDRLPPNAPEAECGVIGCILLESQENMAEAVQTIKSSEAFYDLRLRTAYKALVEMYSSQVPIDTLTLCQRLKDRQQLESVGGLAFISELPNQVPSSSNLSYYVQILNDKYDRRQLIQVCTEAVGSIYDDESTSIDPLVEMISITLNAAITSKVNTTMKTSRELVHEALNVIEDLHHRQGKLNGLATGLYDLDKLTQGLKNKEMIIIAARPSGGKTAISLNIVSHVALQEKLPVGIFSLEMSALSLMLRMICARAQVNLRNIGDGFLAERDFPKLTGSAGKFSNAPIHIDDTDGMTILQLRAKARTMAAQFGIKLLVVDQLSLIQSGFTGMKREREVSHISKQLKSMAKELDIPVIVLHQINREAEREKNRKPRLSDLRESGDIEADADLVIFLHRPEEEDDNSEARSVDAILAKHRNGPTGTVHLLFLKCFTKFESAAKVMPDYLPTQEP